MNIHYLIQRLIGRATCVMHEDAVLAWSARIRNIRGESRAIVVGRHTRIRGELLTFAHGGEITIGEWCYVGEGTRIWSAASIAIGDRVLISHAANIFDSLTHPIRAADRHEQTREIYQSGHPRQISLGESPVRICDDAWIGAGAFVLRGVVVGEGAVVAAGAVVTKDVPPYTIVAGNPAVVVRELTADER
ncbi:DapH/DapD/GlmU-related protein [Afipia sp. GAS231]|uniref:acyltransferase n=1 Tax=Afipia sp. GAS231 TaxID=1882747 RepID=UPI00087A7342|nr:acyltransferase [Afipia sp. GAS231]SDN36427.1 Acetyltransferase (isoleucine patch superfamily) [Afipia sp. GAS231]